MKGSLSVEKLGIYASVTTIITVAFIVGDCSKHESNDRVRAAEVEAKYKSQNYREWLHNLDKAELQNVESPLSADR